MGTPEADRQALYNRADEVLGKPYSDILMASLPVNAAEFATKSDVDGLRTEIVGIKGELAEIRSMFHRLHKTIIWAMVSLTGIFSVVVTVIR